MIDIAHHESSDEQLLAAFARGDRTALGELAARYERAALGLAAGLLGGDRDAACDAVQEAWIKVIRSSTTFKGRSSFKTWLYRIVINTCRDLRKKRRMMAIEHTPQAPPPTTPYLEQQDERQRLHDALDRLSDERREVVLLVHHGDMTHEMAADLLDIPVGTVKSRLHAAMKQLRESLKPVEART